MSDIIIQPKINSIAEKFSANVPRLIKGNELAIGILKDIQTTVIESDEQREEVVQKLTKVRDVYGKVNGLRTEISGPLDELKDYLMSFERPISDKEKDNEYSRAKLVVTQYDQFKLDAKKKAELAALQQQQIANYKADLKASVGKGLTSMMSGIKSNLIQGMTTWCKALTLEDFDAKNAELVARNPKPLPIDKYNACFHMNFDRLAIINEADTKAFIEGLKAEYPYQGFSDTYVAMATEILNEYRAKMPVIKEELIANKNNKEAAALRLQKMEEEEKAALDKVQQETTQALTAVDDAKDMDKMEAIFVQQMQTNDLEAGPVKHIVEFENDKNWLAFFLNVVSEVAVSSRMVAIRKKNGEYIDSIAWWMDKFATLGRPGKGLKVTEVAKTILRKNKE